jgi:rhodanese-related sulfurtransferase
VPTQHDVPYPDVARISPGEASASANAGRAVIVDVRDGASYDQLHAAGAISLPLAELADRHRELPEDRQILTYCT